MPDAVLKHAHRNRLDRRILLNDHDRAGHHVTHAARRGRAVDLLHRYLILQAMPQDLWIARLTGWAGCRADPEIRVGQNADEVTPVVDDQQRADVHLQHETSRIVQRGIALHGHQQIGHEVLGGEGHYSLRSRNAF